MINAARETLADASVTGKNCLQVQRSCLDKLRACAASGDPARLWGGAIAAPESVLEAIERHVRRSWPHATKEYMVIDWSRMCPLTGSVECEPMKIVFYGEKRGNGSGLKSLFVHLQIMLSGCGVS
jgi:hypothetical protein